LSVLIWLPIGAGVLVLLLGERNIVAGRWIALAATILTLILSLPLIANFDTGTANFQFTRDVPWISRFHATMRSGWMASRCRWWCSPVYTIFDSHRRLVRHRSARRAVLRRLPHHGRTDDRGVLATDALLFYSSGKRC